MGVSSGPDAGGRCKKSAAHIGAVTMDLIGEQRASLAEGRAVERRVTTHCHRSIPMRQEMTKHEPALAGARARAKARRPHRERVALVPQVR